MPITRLKTTADPYAPLAWTTSIAVLALEKLRKSKNIRDDELKALDTVAEQLDLFSKASEISLEDSEENTKAYVEPRLRSSFFALRAIKGRQSTSPIKAPQFKKAGEEIHLIRNQYIESKSSEELDQDMLKNAQDLCVELLEHLNKRRANLT